MISWFRGLQKSLNEKQTEVTVMHEDNTACMRLAKKKKGNLLDPSTFDYAISLPERRKVENNEL